MTKTRLMTLLAISFSATVLGGVSAVNTAQAAEYKDGRIIQIAERDGNEAMKRKGDFRENKFDRREDVRDHREDIRDRKESKWDEREDRMDHREDRWDRGHGPDGPDGRPFDGKHPSKEQIEAHREKMQERREDNHDKMEAFREHREERHENFKERAENFRDERPERTGE